MRDEDGGALDGIFVVDVTSGVAGAYAGKLLADLGARVVVVEPGDGNPLRSRPPVPDGGPHGALFAHLSGGKQSVRPQDHEDARQIVSGLMRRADVLLVDAGS